MLLLVVVLAGGNGEVDSLDDATVARQLFCRPLASQRSSGADKRVPGRSRTQHAQKAQKTPYRALCRSRRHLSWNLQHYHHRHHRRRHNSTRTTRATLKVKGYKAIQPSIQHTTLDAERASERSTAKSPSEASDPQKYRICRKQLGLWVSHFEEHVILSCKLFGASEIRTKSGGPAGGFLSCLLPRLKPMFKQKSTPSPSVSEVKKSAFF